MTSDLALVGLLCGLGLLAMWRGYRAAEPSLAEALDLLDPVAVTPSVAGGTRMGLRQRQVVAGETLLSLFGRTKIGKRRGAGGLIGGLETDLAVTGRDRSRLAASVATGAIGGGAALPALSALAAFAGISVPIPIPLVGCLLLGTGGALLPVFALRREAESKRRRFRQALACWLELVAMGQAAGMGIESALHTASGISPDESFTRIGLAVDLSRHAGGTAWAGLAQLGAEIGVAELEELGATVMLAGTEGARVRASLVAKASSMRRRELSESESEANSTTERLFLPAIVLMFGFLLFLGYPAVISLTQAI